MKTTLKLLILVALAVSTVAVIALAGEGRRDRQGPVAPLSPLGPGLRGGPNGPGLNRPWATPDPVSAMQQVLRRLDLTKEQREEIKEIVKANRDGLEKARDTRGAALKAFASAVEAGDEAGIRAAGGVLGNALADMAVLRTQAAAAIKKALTEEQIQQLDGMRERIRDARVQNPGLQARRGSGRGGPGLGRGIGLGPQTGLGPMQRNAGPWQGQAVRPQRPAMMGPNQLANPGVFQRIDRNGDGAITQQELRAFQKRGWAEPRL
jgi:Spy/CpxP family protein refolding chaperone